MWKIILLCFVIGCARCLLEQEIKLEFTKKIIACTKDHPVDMAELSKLQMLAVPKNYEVKCLLACAYRLDKTMTDKGLYNVSETYKVAESMKKVDEKMAKNAKKLGDICSKVNDEEVTDGEKGCERAALLFKCITDNSRKLGFKI